jgi:hypothetical protein
MPSTAHHVTFRFRLPPALLLRAPLGFWPRAPRGCTLDVGEEGNVLVTSLDRHMSYATDQVLKTAARFLAAIGADAPLQRLTGFLSTPATREAGAGHPARYSIALGAKVSITRVLIEEAPVMVEAEPPLRLVSAV